MRTAETPAADFVSAGAKKEGALGFFKGIGKGLVGVVARPTGGIVDMASSTFQGIQRYCGLLGQSESMLCFLFPPGGRCPRGVCVSIVTADTPKLRPLTARRSGPVGEESFGVRPSCVLHARCRVRHRAHAGPIHTAPSPAPSVSPPHLLLAAASCVGRPRPRGESPELNATVDSLFQFTRTVT